MIFLAKGTFKLGCRTVDKNGNEIKNEPPRFEANPDGGSVAIGIMDDETQEQVGTAELFGDFDHWQIATHVLKLLEPTRAGNMPDFKGIFSRMYEEELHGGCPFRSFCEDGRCSDCVCSDWLDEIIEETENNS